MFIFDTLYSFLPESFKVFYRNSLKIHVKNAKEFLLIPYKKFVLFRTLVNLYFKHRHVYPPYAIDVNNASTVHYWKGLIRGADYEMEAKAWLELVRSHTMVCYDSYLALANIVKYIEDNRIPGRIVETGTWKGGALAFMAKAHMAWGHEQREFWGFDSFEGIPEPNAEHDPMDWATEEMMLKAEECTGQLRSVNALVANEQDVYDVMKRIEFPLQNLKIFKGWFQETLPLINESEIGDIAILRLDGDLYDSTLVCLEKFEPHVVSGGFVFIDDWGLAGAKKAVIDYYTKKYGKMPFVNFIDHCSRYIHVTR